jgi:hypothetical protein
VNAWIIEAQREFISFKFLTPFLKVFEKTFGYKSPNIELVILSSSTMDGNYLKYIQGKVEDSALIWVDSYSCDAEKEISN